MGTNNYSRFAKVTKAKGKATRPW